MTVPKPRTQRVALVAVVGLILLVAIVGVWWLTRSPSTTLAKNASTSTSPSNPKGDHWAKVLEGRRFLRQNRYKDAFDAVSGIRDEAPGAGQAMTVAGLALIQFRQLSGARLALERALKLEPDQPDALKALATLQLMLGNGARGAELLQRIVELDPADTKTWLTMARVAHDLGDTSKSADAFAEVLKREPENREALVGLIGDLLNGARAKEAAPWIDRGLKNRPDDPELLGLAARQARDDGRAEDSVALATRALKQDPDNLNALMSRSRARLAANQPAEALPDAERAVKAHPNDAGALQLLAQIEAQLGLAERARATRERRKIVSERSVRMYDLTQEIAARPDDPEPQWKLGQAAADAGIKTLAAQCFRAALALDPNCKQAQDGLAALEK